VITACYGGDHPELEKVVSAALGERAAIALSRGRFPKGYAHLDPNEDAVIAAVGSEVTLLAVADGHNGVEAADAAIGAIADAAAKLIDEPLHDGALVVEDLFAEARTAVGEAIRVAPEERQSSRTALSVALIADGTLHTATLGDTAVLLVRGGKAKVVSDTGPFLGPQTRRPAATRIGVRRDDVVVCVTDGIVDYLGRRWLRTLADTVLEAPSPEAAALGLLEAAMAGGAGDNVAVALTDV
jgi:serine/threonine protein phosphatase PrpC